MRRNVFLGEDDDMSRWVSAAGESDEAGATGNETRRGLLFLSSVLSSETATGRLPVWASASRIETHKRNEIDKRIRRGDGCSSSGSCSHLEQ